LQSCSPASHDCDSALTEATTLNGRSGTAAGGTQLPEPAAAANDTSSPAAPAQPTQYHAAIQKNFLFIISPLSQAYRESINMDAALNLEQLTADLLLAYTSHGRAVQRSAKAKNAWV
jgi:hypothetical protein